jgi:hypothetical protein
MTTIVDPTLTPTAIHVYEAIRTCWLTYNAAPSQYELRVACRCSSTSIQKAFKALREKGHILVPKFGVRAVRPVDMERRVLRDPPDPFEELEEKTAYWRDQV